MKHEIKLVPLYVLWATEPHKNDSLSLVWFPVRNAVEITSLSTPWLSFSPLPSKWVYTSKQSFGVYVFFKMLQLKIKKNVCGNPSTWSKCVVVFRTKINTFRKPNIWNGKVKDRLLNSRSTSFPEARNVVPRKSMIIFLQICPKTFTDGNHKEVTMISICSLASKIFIHLEYTWNYCLLRVDCHIMSSNRLFSDHIFIFMPHQIKLKWFHPMNTLTQLWHSLHG